MPLFGYRSCGGSGGKSLILVSHCLWRSLNLAIILILLVIVSIEGCSILYFIHRIQSVWYSRSPSLASLINHALNLIFVFQFTFRRSCAHYNIARRLNALLSFLNYALTPPWWLRPFGFGFRLLRHLAYMLILNENGGVKSRGSSIRWSLL